MGCLWCGKHSRQCKTMPSGPPEFIPPFIPVTGMKCSYGKISNPLTEISVGKTEISGTEPARPLIWTHRKFYKGFRGEARSRTPGQPGQPGSYEEALNNVLKYAIEIIKLILAGNYKTTKSNSFRLGYFPVYLGYGICKFVLFLFYCLLLIIETTTSTV